MRWTRTLFALLGALATIGCYSTHTSPDGDAATDIGADALPETADDVTETVSEIADDVTETGDDAETDDDAADVAVEDSTADADPDADTDGDAIRDVDEGTGDADGDTVPDYLDLDSDDDGIPDRDEAGDTDLATPPASCDDDGVENFRDPDSDDDGLSDWEELTLSHTDRCYADTDGDGVTDYIEVRFGTDPLDPACSPRTGGVEVIVLDPWAPPDPESVVVGAEICAGDPPDLPRSVTFELSDDPLDGIDAAVEFVDRVEANTSAATYRAGTPCDAMPVPCATDIAAEDSDADTVVDRFPAVPPGRSVCFSVVARTDATVPDPTADVQIYPVLVRIIADGSVVAERPVVFLIPPEWTEG